MRATWAVVSMFNTTSGAAEVRPTAELISTLRAAAPDSKLRGCDVVAVRVDDVAPSGYTMDRATIRQKKTGSPVRFELTDHTRQAIDEYLRLTGRKAGQFLFAGRDANGPWVCNDN